MSALENRPVCWSTNSTSGELRCFVLVYMCLTVFSSSFLVPKRPWLLTLCLRQCNLRRNILERDAGCGGGGGGNVGVVSQ
jgi:hypothetical protein